jgi:carboxylesterase type B
MTTDCPSCERVEMTRRQRMIADITRAIIDRYQHRGPAQIFLEGYARTMQIMLGTAQPEPTWYEKHRARWEETGDVMELERMTRHLEAS